MFSRPKILFLVSLLFVESNPYLPFKFLIFYHSFLLGLGTDRTTHTMGVSDPISVGYTIYGITYTNIIGYQIDWNLTNAGVLVKWHYWPDQF